jgi:hypothetical protein
VRRIGLRAAFYCGAAFWFGSNALQAQGLLGDDAAASTAPAPRTVEGHPDLSGFWKGSKATKPVGNIGKDLPGYTLPLTPAGAAALKNNLTNTVDPESRCLIGGIPRHDASALPFSIVQNKDHVAWLYMYTYFRSSSSTRWASRAPTCGSMRTATRKAMPCTPSSAGPVRTPATFMSM